MDALTPRPGEGSADDRFRRSAEPSGSRRSLRCGGLRYDFAAIVKSLTIAHGPHCEPNPNLFVAGWRPFIGWVCGCGLAYQYVVSPFLTWGSDLAGHKIVGPALDLGTLVTLLFGMLGLGAMRTYEKVSGLNPGH